MRHSTLPRHFPWPSTLRNGIIHTAAHFTAFACGLRKGVADMCIAVPMRVVEVHPESRTATASLHGNVLTVDITLVSPAPGDHVLVHAGCALEIVSRDLAAEILEIFDELAEAAGFDPGRGAAPPPEL